MGSTTSTTADVITNDSTVENRLDEDRSRSSESESPKRGLVRAGMALTDQVVVSATNFLTLFLIARLCAQSEVGLFHLAWTIIGFLRTGQERLISAPYFAFVHRTETDEPSFLGSSLMHQWIFAGISGAVTLAFSLWFAYSGKLAGMSGILLVLAGSIPFLLLRDHVRAVCAAHFQYPVALAVDSCACVIQLAGILILAKLGWLDLPRVAGLLGLACLVPTITWLYLSRKRIVIRPESTRSDWRQNWNYSRWLVVARTLGIGGYYTVPWIVVSVMDEASAGGFAVASGLVGLSMMFINGSNNFFQPRTIRAFHTHGLRRMGRTIVESIVVIGGMLVAAVLLFFFFGDTLMGLIYGSAYAKYGDVVFWLSLSMLAVSVSIVCGNGLAALTKPRGYLLGELSYCLVTITSAFLLIPPHGLNGAAISLVFGGVAASVVTGMTLLYFIRREHASTEEASWS